MKDNNFLVNDNFDNTESTVKPLSKSNNTYLIIAIVILLLLITGIGAFFFLNQDTQIKTQPSSNEPVFYDFPEIIVNLTTATNENVYLKLSLVFSLNSNNDLENIEHHLPKIKDNLEIFLRELRPVDFSIAGSTITLKEEITKRINATISPMKIEEVLFRTILIN